MNKSLLVSSLGAFSLATAVYAGLPYAEWTFETSLPAATDSSTNGPLPPEVGSGSANGFHALATSDWSNPAGNGSNESWSVNTWSPGDYFQFQVSTIALTGVASALELSWDHTSSSTGPKSFGLEYSTDGTSFTTLLSYTALVNSNVAEPDPQARSVWSSNPTTPGRQAIYTFTADTSGISGGLIGETAVYFRVTDTEDNVSTATGTSRLDNFAIAYTPVPEPEEYAAMFAASLGAFALLRRRFARK